MGPLSWVESRFLISALSAGWVVATFRTKVIIKTAFNQHVHVPVLKKELSGTAKFEMVVGISHHHDHYGR